MRDRLRLKREYELSRQLEGRGIISMLGLERHGDNPVLVQEDVGGESLDRVLKRCHRFELGTFLRLAIELSDAVGTLHEQDVIHKDLNPSNIIWNEERERVWLIDFGLSTQMEWESPQSVSGGRTQGTLWYISPEQTGRTKRLLDYRSDFYSLGVTLYELLTGRKPFETDEPTEMIHNHLARRPVQPHRLRGDVPEQLSQVIMKLMSKRAGDRYQSAHGLRRDLQRCLDSWNTRGSIGEFELGQDDVRAKLRLSERLYGRQPELEKLRQYVGETGEGRRMLALIKGGPGVGKSALVGELQVPVLEREGWFASGKFEPPRQARPYTAFGAAMGELIDTLLGRSDEELKRWRRWLESALGEDASLVAGVIPQLDLIIDIAPTESHLDLTEAKHRFRRAFRRFVRVFTDRSRPLVISLDDMQWADDASLELIELLSCDEELKHLLIVGTYRDNEVDGDHPLEQMLERLQRSEQEVQTIALSALEEEAVRQLVADSLGRDVDAVRSLADLIHRKTSGNPYFVRQFLTTIYHQRLLWFESDTGRWEWAQEKIAAMPVTENVIEILSQRLQTLDEDTRDVLRRGALLGRRFQLQVLAAVCDLSISETYRRLKPAVDAEVLIPGAGSPIAADDEEAEQMVVIFPHDRVQEAVFGLWEPEEREEAHLEIGRRLKGGVDEELSAGRLFMVVEHLNQGIGLMDAPRERRELVRLNLRAAKLALGAQGIALAAQLLATAQQLMGDEAWETDFELTREIHFHRSRAEMLQGQLERAKELAVAALGEIDDPVGEAKFFRVLIEEATLRGEFEEAIAIGRRALKGLGHPLSISDLEETTMDLMAKLEDRLEGRPLAEVLQRGDGNDARDGAALEILASLHPAAGLHDFRLLIALGLVGTLLTVETGMRPESVTGLALYGMSLCVFDDPHRGYEAGELALERAREYGEKAALAHVLFVFAAMIAPWSRSLQDSLALLEEGKQAGAHSGNYLFAGYNALLQVLHHFYLGIDLDEVYRRAADAIEWCRALGNDTAAEIVAGIRMVATNLLGDTDAASEFRDTEYKSAQHYLSRCREHDTRAGEVVFRIARAKAHYVYGRTELALAELNAIEDDLAPLVGTFDTGRHPFFQALSLADVCLSRPEYKREERRDKLDRLRAKVARLAEACPSNFRHKLLLIDAERARLDGGLEEAYQLYDAAIREAAEQRLVHLEALANERAGLFWLARNKEQFAAVYLREARYLYELWGAQRKVEMLEEEHEYLVQPPATRETTSSSGTSGDFAIDIDSIFQASEAIAGPIDEEELLSKLMEVTLASAGAQRAAFVVVEDSDLCVAVEGEADHEPLIHEPKKAVDDWTRGAQSIVRFVYRTGQPVVLGRAYRQPRFGTDPYIEKTGTRSVLCIPTAEQGEMRGILYAENNLVNDAFGEERIRMMKILGGHIAIALNKARLYATLREEKERFRQLAENIHEVFWLMDWPSKEIVYLSPAYNTVWGRAMPALPMTIDTWVDGICEEDRERVANALRDQAAQGTYDETYRIERDSGARRWIRDRGFPIRNEDGETYRIAGVAVDITREHEVDRMKEEFISVVSHELRTPLTPVTGIFSMLDREYAGELPEHVREMVGLGLRNSRRLLQLIDDLLDIQKLSMKKVDFSLELLDINDVVAEALELNAPMGKMQNISFDSEPSATPLLIEGDRSRLLQVLTNLLSNAVKFSDPGDRVDVEVDRVDGRARIAVSDYGPGIPVEARQQVFEKFTQADASLTRAHGGTGLGLAIARSIVERLEGSIYFDTELGRGTTFFVEFPLVDR